MPLLTFVSNHDVIRLASVLKKKEHYTLAMAALLLLPGIPCFYYGDEFGVEVRVAAVTISSSNNKSIIAYAMYHSARILVAPEAFSDFAVVFGATIGRGALAPAWTFTAEATMP